MADGTVQSFGATDGLRGQFIAAIHEESDGTLWFSTYEHGLHRYRNGRFAALTAEHGLPHDGGTWSLLEDHLGGIWMSSDRGIIRADRAELHAVADAIEQGAGSPAVLTPILFTEAEGLPSRESNRGAPAGVRLSDNRLVFNNLAGLVVIDPELMATAPPPPNTAIEAVWADGRVLPIDNSSVTVPAGTKQLAIDFVALSFLAPLQNRHRYRLEGYDEDWVSNGTTRRASYTNLRPGGYTFRVQSASGTGEWSEAEALLELGVTPLLWQSWAVRVPAVLLLAGLAAFAYRYRVQRLLELERLRLRIASDLHDDVGSNLSSIALLSEMLQSHDQLDDRGRRQLERIHHAAGETIIGLRDIIWLVDPRHDNAADLIRRMRKVTADVLNGAEHEFVVREPIPLRPLDMNFMRNVFLLYKESLTNLAKHAQASRVRVGIAYENSEFVLEIEDDGRGFHADQAQAGHGLGNMRRRAQQAGGRLDIDSAPGNGTRIRFTPGWRDYGICGRQDTVLPLRRTGNQG
jgi:signal transduction histidine kinase